MNRIDQILELIDEVIDVGDQHTLEPPVDPDWDTTLESLIEATLERDALLGPAFWNHYPRDAVMGWWLVEMQSRLSNRPLTIYTTTA